MGFPGNRSRRSGGGDRQKNNNTLFLSVNEEKRSDKSPDYRGQGVIGGVEVWVSGWLNENARGEYIQIKVQRKDDSGGDSRGGRGGEERGRGGSQRRRDEYPDRNGDSNSDRDGREEPPAGDFDDDIPF